MRCHVCGRACAVRTALRADLPRCLQAAAGQRQDLRVHWRAERTAAQHGAVHGCAGGVFLRYARRAGKGGRVGRSQPADLRGPVGRCAGRAGSGHLLCGRHRRDGPPQAPAQTVRAKMGIAPSGRFIL